MIEFIRLIPGPIYLAIFFAFSLLCVMLMKLLIDADTPAVSAPVEQTNIDPIAIAALQGGVNGVIRSRVFTLMKLGLVVIDGMKKNMLIRSSGAPSHGVPSAIDIEVLAFLSTVRKPEELFRDRGLKERIEAHLAGVSAGLEARNFLRNKDQLARAMWVALCFGLLIAVAAGMKLHLGLKHGKPVLFLVLLLIAAEVLLYVVYRKTKRTTRLGRSYLKNMRKQFRWTLRRRVLPEGLDPALLVAIFGAGHLYVNSLYPQYTEAFKRSANGSGCGGGCGGGCSSSGSSSGGCSGGCGGCGGD